MGPLRRVNRNIGIGLAGDFAVSVGIPGLVESVFSRHQPNTLLQYAAAFACFSFMLGSIFAFNKLLSQVYSCQF
jgi:hypothetical protein